MPPPPASSAPGARPTPGGGVSWETAGKLGAVPPAVATFAKTAQAQHKDHAAAWNAVLTSAGKPAIMGIDKTVQDTIVTPGFANVKDVVGLAKFALALEDVAAATYLNGIENALQDPGAIKVAASIQPVEMQHSAILHFVLGDYPVPDSFSFTQATLVEPAACGVRAVHLAQVQPGDVVLFVALLFGGIVVGVALMYGFAWLLVG